MSEIYFSNYQFQDNIQYFLYIGELKNYGLNIFLKEALSHIHNRQFDFISIVPDIFEQYNYKNFIVVNPLAKEYCTHYGRNVSCRTPASTFFSSVSESRHVTDLIHKLLRKQGNLYIYMYESTPAMTLDTIPGVSVLGPNSKIARKLNSKIYQYTSLKDHVNIVDFCICKGLDDLKITTNKLWHQWKDGIFVSLEYSA
ncbi:hypothetical protein ACFL0O_10180, partial [Thermodesulfobacteriota bacterium]